MKSTPIDKYELGLSDIDDIFRVSRIIKDAVLNNLSSIDLGLLSTYSAKKTIENTISMLSGLDKSIDSAEKNRINRLYSQGIVLVVSLAEELLKSEFEHLIDSDLEHIKNIEKLEFSLKEIANRNYKLSRDDWVEIVLTKIYDSKNPEEKINFQNVRSIEGIFKSYFGIDIKIETIFEQKIHLYFQIRHIILHNNSRIDDRFLSNLDKAGIETNPYKKGEKIRVRKIDYEDSKEVFRQFFISLQESKSNE